MLQRRPVCNRLQEEVESIYMEPVNKPGQTTDHLILILFPDGI